MSIEHLPAYDVMGPPHAFPIVLIHGAAWTRNMWLPQIEALSDEFRVLAIDLPGHGTYELQTNLGRYFLWGKHPLCVTTKTPTQSSFGGNI